MSGINTAVKRVCRESQNKSHNLRIYPWLKATDKKEGSWNNTRIIWAPRKTRGLGESWSRVDIGQCIPASIPDITNFLWFASGGRAGIKFMSSLPRKHILYSHLVSFTLEESAVVSIFPSGSKTDQQTPKNSGNHQLNTIQLYLPPFGCSPGADSRLLSPKLLPLKQPPPSHP